MNYFFRIMNDSCFYFPNFVFKIQFWIYKVNVGNLYFKFGNEAGARVFLGLYISDNSVVETDKNVHNLKYVKQNLFLFLSIPSAAKEK